jgi:hypothetical protein
MAHSRAAVVSLALLAVGTFIEAHSQADAGIIEYTASYEFVSHGTNFDFYRQFDPALGTLTEVAISDAGSAANGALLILNTSNEDQTFTLSWSFSLQTDGGGQLVSGTLTETLKPGDSADLFPSTDYSFSTTYTNTSFWIGTCDLGAEQYAAIQGAGLIGPLEWTVDNTNIFVDNIGESSLVGEETITYIYVSAIPEPSTSIMLGTACLLLLGRQCLRRRRI